MDAVDRLVPADQRELDLTGSGLVDALGATLSLLGATAAAVRLGPAGAAGRRVIASVGLSEGAGYALARAAAAQPAAEDSGSSGEVTVLEVDDLEGLRVVWIVPLERMLPPASLDLYFSAPREPSAHDLQELAHVTRVLTALLDAAATRRSAAEARGHLDALEEITRSLAQAFTPAQVAQAMLESCAGALGATTASLALVDAPSSSMQLLGITGLPAEIVKEWLTFPLDTGTPLGEAAVLGTPVFVETAEERDRRYPALREMGQVTGSGPVAGIPLHLGGEVIAAVAFTFPGARRRFSRAERFFLSNVGFHCAAALARARVLEREHRASRTLEGALERTSWLQMLAATLTSAADERAVLEALDGQGLIAMAGRALAVVEPTSASGAGTVLLKSGWPSEHLQGSDMALSALASRAVYTGESLLIQAMEETFEDASIARLREVFGGGAVAVLPYHTTGQPAGALVIIFDARDPFTPEAQGLLTAVAELFGQALARARLFESVQEAEERLRAVVETAVDGIVVIDEKGTIQSVNPAVERIFGYAANELVGRNVSTLMPDPDRSGHDSYLSSYLGGGRPQIIGVGREVLGRRKDGSVFPVDLAVNETALSGRVLFTGILRDITERKRIEAELRSAREAAMEASRVKSRFLESISHELRTPLSAILGFSGLLVEGVHGPLSDAQADAVRRIRRSGQHLLQVIEEVLFYTATQEQAESGLEDLVDLRTLLEEVVGIVRPGAEQKGVDIIVAAGERIPLRTGAGRARRILLHLLASAVKLADGATVTATVEASEKATTVRVQTPGASLSRDELVSIWEPFDRLEHGPPGPLRDLGLGFPISARLARGLGGEIRVESEVGRGTTFSLDLPVDPAEARS